MKMNRSNRRNVAKLTGKTLRKMEILKKYFNHLKRSQFHVSSRPTRPLNYFPLMATKSEFTNTELNEDSITPEGTARDILNQRTDEKVEAVDSFNNGYNDENVKNERLVLNSFEDYLSMPGKGMFPIPRIG